MSLFKNIVYFDLCFIALNPKLLPAAYPMLFSNCIISTFGCKLLTDSLEPSFEPLSTKTICLFL